MDSAFKACNQAQLLLRPPVFNDPIGANQPVRMINAVVDRLDMDNMIETQSGGAASHHRLMLLNVLVYAYICNEYRSGLIEQMLKRAIQIKGISAMSMPGHDIINCFRSDCLYDAFKDVFNQGV